MELTLLKKEQIFQKKGKAQNVSTFRKRNIFTRIVDLLLCRHPVREVGSITATKQISAKTAHWNTGLEVFQKYGARAGISDLGILMGDSLDCSIKNVEGKPSCFTWLMPDDGEVLVLLPDGEEYQDDEPISSYPAIRPIMLPDETRKITEATIKTVSLPNGKTVRMATYGLFPQTVVADEVLDLEKLYQSGKLTQVETALSFDITNVWGNGEAIFTPYKPEVFTYKKDKYLRFITLSDNWQGDRILSTGEEVKDNHVYYTKYEPVEWLVDDTGVWISKKALLAGFPFDLSGNKMRDFTETPLYHRLQDIAQEIERSL